MDKIHVYCNNTLVETFEAVPECCQSFKITPSTANTVIKIAIPMVDIHGFWYCNSSDYRTQMTWNLNFTSALNHGMPFLAFFNMARQLCAAVATDNLIDDTAFNAAINQQNCTYDVTIESTARETFNVIVDLRNDICFTQSLAEWRDRVIPENLYFPAGAWDPVFCTWYAVHGEVTAKWVESQAVKASTLGFGTLIVDDGWCYDEFKRVTPTTLPNWYNTIGDWKISDAKFPNFREHVKKIQNTGLKYLLWVAPHLIGVDSEIGRNHADWTHEKFLEGCRHLKIDQQDAVDCLCEKLISLAADNGLDGLKIDFLDIVKPAADAPIGRANRAMLEKLCGTLRKNNPEALIEFRQRYATIAMLPYATQFRAGDVPFDWALNYRRLVDIRLSIGDGVPVHADPAYWSADEYPENVARHMMVMLLGVPMLSMDLNTLPAEHLAIIQYYLKLYHDKKQLLNFGHWEFLFSSADAAVAMVSNDKEVLAVVMDAAYSEKLRKFAGDRKLTLLNASADTIYLDGKTVAPGESLC